MKKRVLTSAAVLTLALLNVDSLRADASSHDQDGSVKVEASKTTNPLDPEKPGNEVDPGEGPSTEGSLRIDYASSLNFGSAEIAEGNRTYAALAQQFHSDTGPRGSYVQITDLREGTPGWSLQVKQETQFKNTVIQEKSEQELAGAVLSLDKGWANSAGNGKAPTVQRDTIALNSIGNAYQVASASKGAGNGTWTIAFGASEENEGNQPVTITPLKDSDGKVVLDSTYNKTAYSNSAINLSIPEKTKIHPVQYQTELTWILQAVPGE